MLQACDWSSYSPLRYSTQHHGHKDIPCSGYFGGGGGGNFCEQ